MSRVFLATETTLGRQIVVKVLPPEAAAAVSAGRFKREIQLAARLQHPHIVPLLSAGETDGLPFYTMPYVRGESLARLSQRGELSVNEAVHVLRDIASALAYAHDEGVVNRDIKPENVILTGGVAVVTDFGIAKAMSDASIDGHGDAITTLGVALGTPAYMVPEQATADPHVDRRADIYSFGCQLTSMPSDEFKPAWSPDDNLISFHSQRSGVRQIYTMNADGSGETQVTNGATQDVNRAWSPNGRRIAFAAMPVPGRRAFLTEYAVKQADGSWSAPKPVQPPGDTTGVGKAVWSPDGALLAYTFNGDVYVMPADGGARTLLATVAATGGPAVGLAWRDPHTMFATIGPPDFVPLGKPSQVRTTKIVAIAMLSAARARRRGGRCDASLQPRGLRGG